VTPTVNSSRVRRELDQFFGGDYLSEETVPKAARVRGFSTAVILSVSMPAPPRSGKAGSA
jgi:hypothetical protein